MQTIKILPIASGSGGNATYIEFNGSKLLVDLGVSYKKISNALSLYGLSLNDLDGVFITHDHYDHVLGFPVTAKHLNAPIYASKRTRDQLASNKVKGLEFEKQHEIFPGFFVTLIPTSHDCPGSCGFIFTNGETKVALFSDLGSYDQKTINALIGTDLLIIEANHDPEMLKNGPYPYPLKRRIASANGHLSNPDCARLAQILYENGTRNFLLAHLSDTNNTPELAYQCIANALKEDALISVLEPNSQTMKEYGI